MVFTNNMSKQACKKCYTSVFWCFFLVIQKQRPQVFYKKAVLQNFAIFTGKSLCWTLFNKVAYLKAYSKPCQASKMEHFTKNRF